MYQSFSPSLTFPSSSQLFLYPMDHCAKFLITERKRMICNPLQKSRSGIFPKWLIFNDSNFTRSRKKKKGAKYWILQVFNQGRCTHLASLRSSPLLSRTKLKNKEKSRWLEFRQDYIYILKLQIPSARTATCSHSSCASAQQYAGLIYTIRPQTQSHCCRNRLHTNMKKSGIKMVNKEEKKKKEYNEL